MLAGLLKKVGKAASKTATKSEASAARNAIRKNPKKKGDKEAAAIAKINQAEFEWPFNSAEHTQVLAVGQEEYTWPTFFKVAEWNSFQIQKDASIGVESKGLSFIERDHWYRSYRDNDDNAGTSGTNCPMYVFPSSGNGYGVSPLYTTGGF